MGVEEEEEEELLNKELSSDKKAPKAPTMALKIKRTL